MSLTESKSESALPVSKQVSAAEAAERTLAEDTRKPARAASPRRRAGASLFGSLVAVLVGSLILRLSAQTMGQMLGFYLESINQNYYPVSYTIQGLVIASFFIPEMLGSPIMGAMSDRYGRKLFILLGPLLGAIAVQITSITVVLWILLFTRLLEGLSTASSVPATLGYISDMTSGRAKLRARIMGLFEITLVGGIALGAITGGYLWKYFGAPMMVLGVEIVSPAFSINGLIYLISFAVFYWGLNRSRKSRTSQAESKNYSEWQRLRHALRSPSVWRFVPAWVAIFAIIGMWTNHSPRLFTGASRFAGQTLNGSISEVQFGNGFAFLAIFFAAGVLGWSFYLNRYRKTSVMLIATVGLMITLLAVYGLNHTESFNGLIYYLLMAVLLLGLLTLSGFTPAALTYLADVTESHKEDRGSIMGLYSVFLGVGQLIGTTTGGRFADWGGIDGLLILCAIFGLLTIWTLVALRRRELPAPHIQLDTTR